MSVDLAAAEVQTHTFLDSFADVVTQLARQVETAQVLHDSLAQNLEFMQGKHVDQTAPAASEPYTASHGIVHSYHDVDNLTAQLRETMDASIEVMNRLGDVRTKHAHNFAEVTRQTNVGLHLVAAILEFAFMGGQYRGIGSFKPNAIDEYTAPGEGIDYARRNLISLYKIINTLQTTLELEVTPLENDLD